MFKFLIVYKKGVLNKITDGKILCVNSCLLNDIKNRIPGPYNSLRHTHDRKHFSNTKSKGSAQDLLGEGSGRNLGMFLLRKRPHYIDFFNSNMVKPEKFDYLHLV